MKKLVDTNIFLEILLDQPARPKCEAFLDNNEDAAGISDFSLHSLGVLLFRKNRAELFRRFVSDTLPELSVLTLSNPGYLGLVEARDKFGLDFDDAYQFCVAKESGLSLATQDKDFLRVGKELQITFI